MQNNRGIDLNREVAEQSQEDWVFGAVSAPCLGRIPREEREAFLPIGELQFGSEDYMDCATRGPINILEAKFTYLYNKGTLKNKKWLEDNGYVVNRRVTFSDRFIAIKSGTTRDGNSLKAPLDCIYRHGLIPKTMLPKVEGSTFEEYHTGITPEMEKLGKEFAARFVINYEKVLEADLAKAAEDDFVDVAVFAWPQPVDGVYHRVDFPQNHVVAISEPQYVIYDNYLDGDGDFVKHLADNYDFWMWGYRVFISREVTPEQLALAKQLTPLGKIQKAILDIWAALDRIYQQLYGRN